MNVPLKVVCIMELERFNLEDAPEIQQEEEQSEDKSRCPWIKCSIHDTVAKWMLPEEARATYLERANCIPPPIFILAISLAELAAFIYYAVWKPQKQWITLDMGIWESPFIYRPDKRKEAWRFLSYMFLHAGLEHIIGNLVLQLCLGIPLELVHKGHRVGAVYLAGVIAELPRNDSSVWSCKTAVHQPNSWNRCRICFVQKISLSFKWASVHIAGLELIKSILANRYWKLVQMSENCLHILGCSGKWINEETCTAFYCRMSAHMVEI
ncbi:rhomboid-related protein 2 isoform X5 [Python bivittatus]|uniref:rhomboid protease n=1 Tax=Python bivittatus TaxID=176946 RepID=A0A9F5J2F6_PYTBI|nr:rhomboid-related protein 2 isoform X5 [Python bivittatus]